MMMNQNAKIGAFSKNCKCVRKHFYKKLSNFGKYILYTLLCE